MSDAVTGGPARVAAFLLSLEREAAAQILRHLSPGAIGEVAQAMTELAGDAGTPERIQALYRELAAQAVGKASVRPAQTDELSRLLEASIGPERGREVLAQIQRRRQQERPFAALEGFAPNAVAKVLRSESPAVAALVLAHLDPAVSAAVLANYENDEALDVVRRMTSLTPPGFPTLIAIAEDLAEQLSSGGDEGGSKIADPSQRLASIAEMLAYTGQEIEQTVLSGLEADAAEVAQEIREYMFTWDDLGTVDQRAMQKILSQVNTKTLSIALKACTQEVEGNILAGLSQRVREMVKEERELAGAMPMSEVQVCRDEIMQAVRALMDSGEFRPRRAGEDLVE